MKVEHEAATFYAPSVTSETFQSEVSTPRFAAVAEDLRAKVARLVREGVTAAKAGNLPAAREILQRAVELDEQHETALMWLASISDKPHNLLGYLQRVLAINPANERAAQWEKATRALLAKSLIQQGAASHKEGMPEIAAQYFLQATEYEPTNETAWLWLVSVSSEPEDKLSYLNRILNLNPSHEKALALFHKTKTQIARTLVKKGNAAAVAGDWETAREILRDVMEYNPNLEEAWLLKAVLSDSAEEKTACFEKALEINPESEQAQNGLETLRLQQEPEIAVEEPFEDVSEELPAPENFMPEVFAENFSETPTPVFEIETLVEDDAPEQQFIGDHYEQFESIEKSSVEQDLAHEQTSYVEESFAPRVMTYFTEPPAENYVVELRAEENYVQETYAEQNFTAGNQGNQTRYYSPNNYSEGNLLENPAAENSAANFAQNQTQRNFIEDLSKPAEEVAPETFVDCRFCEGETPDSSPRCQNCGAFFRLENFDRLLANELNDETGMRAFIEDWQGESNERELSAVEFFNLGLAYLNLRNVKKAVANFEQVLGISAQNQEWNEQITALLHWISENMPEILGSGVSRTGKTIMVVDDSPTVRKLIVGKLEKYGHNVVAAVDGIDALSKINETVPDLILLDVTMPRLDGYQLCKLVKSNAKTKHVPVVMISGKDGFFDRVRGRMAGSTAYITKPFGPETLLQTVDTYCR